jgi:hypothetical protein
LEIGLTISPRSILAVEARSGQTVAEDYFTAFQSFASLVQAARPRRTVRSFVIYGGNELQRQSAGTVVPWSRIDRCEWWDPAE